VSPTSSAHRSHQSEYRVSRHRRMGILASGRPEDGTNGEAPAYSEERSRALPLGGAQSRQGVRRKSGRCCRRWFRLSWCWLLTGEREEALKRGFRHEDPSSDTHRRYLTTVYCLVCERTTDSEELGGLLHAVDEPVLHRGGYPRPVRDSPLVLPSDVLAATISASRRSAGCEAQWLGSVKCMRSSGPGAEPLRSRIVGALELAKI